MSIVEMRVPTIGESITEVTLSQWLKPNGSMVKLDEPICEFESDKATLEFPAEASGKLEWVAEEDEDLEIGALVARIDTSVEVEAETKKDAPSTTDKKETAAPTSDEKADSTKNVQHPSPAAAKILREKGIDPNDVDGTGKDGRITKEDANKAEAKQQKEEAPASTPTPKSDDSSASTSFSRATTRTKMSRMRRTIAKRLVSAKNSTAMLTTFNEVDLTEIKQIRKTHQEKFVEKHGIKLGFMSFFSKACAIALMEMPDVNARLDDDHLIHHDYADISIAISTPTGLVVPPVHNVESLGLAQIEQEIKVLAEKARKGSLTLEEMQGGTFTITNGGVFGSMMSTPILNEPQSAILGMHAIIDRPVVINGQMEIRPMMYLAMSYDHRVIDGSSSVTFLVRVKQLLENPMTMLLEI